MWMVPEGKMGGRIMTMPTYLATTEREREEREGAREATKAKITRDNTRSKER